MFRKILLLAALTLLACAPSAAFAQDPSWRLTAQSGQVRVVVPSQPVHPARMNEIIPEGAVITTSANSSAVIENGLQRMSMSANSRLTIRRTRTDGMTRIFQDVGTVLFQVDHRNSPHFRVETPLLAAIVKGTRFRVINHRMYDTVVVESGLVEVDANQGNEARDVPTGNAVSIARDEPSRLLTGTPGADMSTTGGGGATAAQNTGALAGHARFPSAAVTGVPNSAEMLRRISDPGAGNDSFVKLLLAYLAACLIFGYIVFVGVSLTSRKTAAYSPMADRVVTPSEKAVSDETPPEQPFEGNRTLRNFMQRKARK